MAARKLRICLQPFYKSQNGGLNPPKKTNEMVFYFDDFFRFYSFSFFLSFPIFYTSFFFLTFSRLRCSQLIFISLSLRSVQNLWGTLAGFWGFLVVEKTLRSLFVWLKQSSPPFQNRKRRLVPSFSFKRLT